MCSTENGGGNLFLFKKCFCFDRMASEQKQKVPLLQRMFSSGASAIITKSIVTPFDVVKTCLQVFLAVDSKP